MICLIKYIIGFILLFATIGSSKRAFQNPNYLNYVNEPVGFMDDEDQMGMGKYQKYVPKQNWQSSKYYYARENPYNTRQIHTNRKQINYGNVKNRYPIRKESVMSGKYQQNFQGNDLKNMQSECSCPKASYLVCASNKVIYQNYCYYRCAKSTYPDLKVASYETCEPQNDQAEWQFQNFQRKHQMLKQKYLTAY